MIAPEQQDPHFRSQRRIRLSNHQTQFGIDTVSLAYDPLRLIVAFVVPVNQEAANNLATILKSITVEHIVVLGEGGVEQNRVSVLAIRPDSIEPLHLLVNLAVDADLSDSALSISIYVLRLVNLAHVDPFFSQASFLLQTNSRSALDPRDSRASAAGVDPGSRAPQIDYLARDYSSFRQLMLNRLASQLPGGIEQQPADLSQALVEVIAYAADRLSYYQDAVATEAYLGTARRRISVRRHSRLIDYAMHEGCNARVWVQIQVQNTLQDALTLPVRTPLLTRALADQEPVLTQQRCDEAIIAGATIFETLHELDLYAEHQQMPLYDWGMREYTLPIGSTKAALKGHFPNLNAGQVIILKELVSPVTGDPADADPEHCLAVRLIEARTDTDALGVDNLSPSENGVPITWISWNGADALPFALVVATPNTASIASVSAARGNIVLADHGRSKTQVPLQPARVPANRRYRPWLPDTGISHSVAYDHPNAQLQPARTMLEQDPRQAVAAVQQLTSTTSGGQSQPKDWYVRRDLLDSDRFAQAFVIESEEDGRAQIRFGDGLHGRLPIAGETFQASYRIGNGQRGNIGRQTITSIAPNADSFAQLSGRVVAVTNPLPAQGGIDPEPIEQVRLYAPRAAHTQERCVVEQDYAAVAERHPDVQKASAMMRWTGSWYTALVVVDRRGGRPIDPAFRHELLAAFERRRLVGYDITIRSPLFVSLDIALNVTIASNSYAASVKQAFQEALSAIDLPGGRRGFFHPDNYTIAQPVYLSPLIARAMSITGVVTIEPVRFQRLGATPQGELQAGVIRLGPLEVARVQNDPTAPHKGLIELIFQGGR